jgi:hypothetical protein
MDKIEEKLKGHYWQGDPEEAKKRGGGSSKIKASRRSFLGRVAILACSCLMVSVASVFVTLAVQNASRADRFGSGGNTDGITYARTLATYCYPAAIYNVADSKSSYADLYYAFNSDKVGFIAVWPNHNVTSSIRIMDSNGNDWFSTTELYGNFGLINLTLSFSAEVITRDNTTVEFPLTTIDLTPFYNSAYLSK